MFRNYFKTACRNLIKRKFFSTLNILGLAIGMAACLLIFQYVAFEYSFDRFNENRQHLYRANMITKQNGVIREDDSYTHYGFGPAVAEQLPEVAGFVRIHPNGSAGTFVTQDQDGQTHAFKAEGVYFVDSSFLDLFSYPLVQGDPVGALNEPHTVLVSESMARRLFGDKNPIGRQIQVIAWTEGTFQVTGVFKDVPENSHLQFNFLLPIQALIQDEHGQYYGGGWSWTNFHTYVFLKPGSDVTAVEKKLAEIIFEHKREQYSRRNMTAEIDLQPLLDIHLYSTSPAREIATGDYKTVTFFTILAAFILIIAWVNYINLATARAVERAKEVGVRKAAGARRAQLLWQFLFESVLMNGFALVLGIGLAWLLLPYLNQLANVSIPVQIWLDPRFWGVFAAMFIAGTGLSTLYPAYVISGFEPARVLKGQTSSLASRASLRKVLVVFQFSVSTALLTGTFIVYSQVEHMHSTDLGIDLEHVLIVRRPPILKPGTDLAETKRTFEEKLKYYPDIIEVAASSAIPGGGHSLGTSFKREQAQPSESAMCKVDWVDYDFADTYALEFVAGRNFGRAFTADTVAALINETAAHRLGFDQPTDALGEAINVGGGGSRFEVIGVTKDFNWMSVAQPTPPLILLLTSGGSHYSIRLKTADLRNTVATVQRVYESVFPGNPFDFFFMDTYFDEQYRADQRFGTLFATFALFAILVACLGLVGLAAYTASQRTKEIGIRKVLGAGLPEIVRLLLADFIKLIGVALVVTVPVAFFGAKQWLQNFASRIDLNPTLFLVPGVVVLAFALLAVSYHTARISLSDPVKSLRYE